MAETQLMEQKPVNQNEALLEEMVKAGLHFGHSKAKKHPKVEPYLFGVRNNICIINLEKTLESLKKAIEFLKSVKESGGMIVFVSTKPSTRDLVRQTAQSLGMPYVYERWLGGTLTNFKTIRNRLDYFEELLAKKEKGQLAAYTKWEQAKFDQELQDLRDKFEGLRPLKNLPQAIFIVDTQEHETAVREAQKIGIPIVAIVDTNANPEEVNWPIPANDDAASSVGWILAKIEEGMK